MSKGIINSKCQKVQPGFSKLWTSILIFPVDLGWVHVNPVSFQFITNFDEQDIDLMQVSP